MCAQTAKQNITIKKYANRRLYNTATSSYVTLEDLSEMVKEGSQFNVYDAKTSEDITRSVLTQIIVEEENKTDQENLLPISFLRQLIGFYGDNLQWMVPKYLEHSMEVLTGNQDQIRDYFQTSLGTMFPFGTTLEEMSKQNMSMFENALRMFSPMNALENIQNPFAMMAGNMLSATPNTTNNNTTSTTANVKTTNTANTKAKANDSCCATSNNNNNSCCSTNAKADNDTKSSSSNTNAQMASVTSLKPRNSDTSNTNATSSSANNATTTTNTATATTSTTTTPMPNVQNVTATNNSGTDDMQQKIANLQRQLADLAKSRA